MKRLLKVFAIALAIVFFGVLASASSTPVSAPEIGAEDICIEEEGIGCKVFHKGEMIAACFICNCAKLAEAALPKEDETEEAEADPN